MTLTKDDYIDLLSIVIEIRKRELDMPEELALVDLEAKLNSAIMSFLPY